MQLKKKSDLALPFKKVLIMLIYSLQLQYCAQHRFSLYWIAFDTWWLKIKLKKKSDLALPFKKGINDSNSPPWCVPRGRIHCSICHPNIPYANHKTYKGSVSKPRFIQIELFEVDQKERISMSELSNESSEGNQNAWSWPQPNTHYERRPWLSPAAQHMSFDNVRFWVRG